MRRRSRHVEPTRIQVNLTAMIDVTINLIIFFILAGQLMESELPTEIDLPVPEQSAAISPDEADRIIVNLIPRPEDRAAVRFLRLGLNQYEPTPAGLALLASEIALARSEGMDVPIEVRADRLTAFEEVLPVLQAVARGGAKQIRVMVGADESESNAAGSRGGR